MHLSKDVPELVAVRGTLGEDMLFDVIVLKCLVPKRHLSGLAEDGYLRVVDKINLGSDLEVRGYDEILNKSASLIRRWRTTSVALCVLGHGLAKGFVDVGKNWQVATGRR